MASFVGIYLVSVISDLTNLSFLDNVFLIGSFGASAVLIYAAPEVEYAQPRNLIGGHAISAFVGITVYKYASFDLNILAALAVSISILLMHLTRTVHPPGGATALIAVIGSEYLHHMGYQYMITVAIGACCMLVVALIVNNLSSDSLRHYPRYWI